MSMGAFGKKKKKKVLHILAVFDLVVEDADGGIKGWNDGRCVEQWCDEVAVLDSLWSNGLFLLQCA